ncbi:MAG: LysR family transcriptional regulator [Paracoccaceae bacterium]
MNLGDVTLLQDVARLGSFAAAAAQRGIDASSVSRMVAGIEAGLGFRVFERTTRRLNLTEVGDLYLTRAAPLTEELTRIAAEARNLRAAPSGLLRLTASVTFGQRQLVPLIGAFRTQHPDVALDCVFTDANVDLIADRIDLAIRLAPTIEGDLIATKLMATHYRVVAAQDYLARHAPLQVPADLRGHRVLLFNLRAFRQRWLFRDGAGTQEVPIAGDITLSPAGTLRDAAIAGLGPALLPDWLVDGDIAAGRLVHCLRAWQVTATDFDTGAWAVYPSRSFLPGKTRAMIDFLRATLPLSQATV